MHLSLVDGPFVPHNLMSAQESPVPLPKFQMASRLKILMSSGSKKGTQIYYPFLSKCPGKRTPSRFPNRAPMERDTRLQGIFTLLLIYLFNISFRVPSKGALPPGPPHRAPSPDSRFPSDIKRPLWKEMPVSGAFRNTSSRVPITEPSAVSLFREKRLIPRPLFIHLQSPR